MTTRAQTDPGRTFDIARDWLDSRRNQATVAVLLYAAIAIGYFGLHVLPHPGQECVCQPGASDPSIYTWNLVWWPHALLHGLNPFMTDALFAPNRVDLGGEPGLMPGAAVVAAPVTLLAGPIVSYNLLTLASPMLAAFFAFLLCRYVSGSFAAGLVGGYVFGFSTYMLGQMLGHLNLVLTFPIPAAVYLALRLFDGRIGERRFIALMALTLAALLLFSTELVTTLVVLGAIAFVVAWALAPADRQRVIALVRPILVAGALAALVTSPVIYYGLKGNMRAGFQGNGELGGDALGFLVPTIVTRFGRKYFADVAASFTVGNFAEGSVYVGLPLVLIVARYTITRWRLASTRILAAMLALVVVLVLGSHLHIAGKPTIPLPWQLIDHSLVRELTPARLGVYMFLIVAVIAAMWLGQPRTGRWLAAKWAMTAVAIAFLLPNISSGLWRSRPPNPPFFATREYRSVLRRGETALVLPFGNFGFSMLWQADTDMWFRMAGGYLWREPTPDYVADPLLPALYGQAKPSPAIVSAFLLRRHVGAVIIGPGAPPGWPGALAALGLKPISLGGVLFYKV